MANDSNGQPPPHVHKNRDERHNLRNERGTFVSRKASREGAVVPLLCRVCGQGLLTNSERLIGVHIGCVSDRTYRSRKAPRGPAYGFRKSDR